MNPAFLRGGPFFSEQEVAEQLHISQDHLKHLRQAGKIAHKRFGRRVLYSQEHVDAFLEESERPARAAEGR